jgi:hypothetical protein
LNIMIQVKNLMTSRSELQIRKRIALPLVVAFATAIQLHKPSALTFQRNAGSIDFRESNTLVHSLDVNQIFLSMDKYTFF